MGFLKKVTLIGFSHANATSHFQWSWHSYVICSVKWTLLASVISELLLLLFAYLETFNFHCWTTMHMSCAQVQRCHYKPPRVIVRSFWEDSPIKPVSKRGFVAGCSFWPLVRAHFFPRTPQCKYGAYVCFTHCARSFGVPGFGGVGGAVGCNDIVELARIPAWKMITFENSPFFRIGNPFFDTTKTSNLPPSFQKLPCLNRLGSVWVAIGITCS